MTDTRNYESLPDLLADLNLMSNSISANSNNKLSWNAQINCGGNYHTFSLETSNSFGRFPRSIDDGNKKSIEIHDGTMEGYADFDSLYAELAHIREFLVTNNLSTSVRLEYAIKANSSTPHLSVSLYKDNRCSYMDDEESEESSKSSGIVKFCKSIIPDRHAMKTYVQAAIILPIVVFPVLYISKKLI